MSEENLDAESAGLSEASVWPSPARALAVTLLVTLAVTGASRLLKGEYANLGVAAIFLGASWWLVLQKDSDSIRAYGLSLGGWFEPEALSAGRILRAFLGALGWAVVLSCLFFPIFAIAFGKVWAPTRTFNLAFPPDMFDRAAGQVVVVALPEEAFFRGYLQSALDGRWGARWRIFDADLGPGWLVTAALFAVGHLLTVPHPGRLAVFFPALAFGWLRARTRGIGAGIAFHAACNLLSTMLAAGFGLSIR